MRVARIIGAILSITCWLWMFYLYTAKAASCPAPKFKYYDVVEIIDKNDFYYKCQGVIRAYTIECKYTIINLCNTGAEDYFDSRQLKYLRRENIK